MVDDGKLPRARSPVPSHSVKRLVAKVYKSIMLSHILLRCLKHGMFFFCFLLNDHRKLKDILCSQVEKVKQVTHTLLNRQKNMEDRIEKVRNQQITMNRSNTGYISVVGLIFRPVLDKNVIPIPLLLYAVYYGFERSIRMSYRHQGTSAMTYLKEG
jgi:hypothetical protein